MTKLTVDVNAIHLVTRHLRSAASDLTPEAEILMVPDGAFESPAASALAATNADLRRQSAAVAEFVTALAEAGDRAAEKIVQADAALASMSPPGIPSGTGAQ
jgi:hypothetical protein